MQQFALAAQFEIEQRHATTKSTPFTLYVNIYDKRTDRQTGRQLGNGTARYGPYKKDIQTRLRFSFETSTSSTFACTTLR